MKMYSPNKITTSQSRTKWEDLIKDKIAARQSTEQGVTKTASTKQAVKVAEGSNEKDEAPSSGQLDVEPLHQTGESTPVADKKSDGKGEAKKEDKSASTVVAEKKEAGKVPDAFKEHQFKKKDAKEGDDKEKKDDKKDEKKEASAKCEACGSCPCEKGCKKAAAAQQIKQAEGEKKGKGDEGKDSGQPAWEGKKENVNDPKVEGEKKDASTENKKFIRIANLDSKTKTWLKDYWKNLYPAEYVDAMIQDK